MSPVRVAIVNDYELVVAGIAGVLAPYEDRVVVVELDSREKVVSPVDVVLYDTFAQAQGSEIDLSTVVTDRSAKVVVFTWNTEPDLVEGTLDVGVAGYISKGVTAAELVDLIERVHAGETITPATADMSEGEEFGRWPGADEGLSPRESEILALICQGHSNEEITEQLFIGINTVKTHIRTMYRKIGVATRTQAVLWGIDHGFRPDRSRTVVE